MLDLDDKKNKLVLSELDIMLLTELGFFSSLKGAKMRFNPRPFSSKIAEMNNENFIDLHLEIAKKIDELIAKNEKELKLPEHEPLSKIQQTLPLNEVMEIREPYIRKPEMPHFKTEIEPKNVFGELSQDEEFFEIVTPTETHFDDESMQVNDDNFDSWMLGGQDKKSQKWFMGLGRIRVREKNKTSNRKNIETKKINNFTKTKIELEKTKKEIEERRKALEEAEKKEKEKEIELKRREVEKKKQEKLQKLVSKKRVREKKLKEKETKRAEKQKQKKLKRLERERLKEKQIKNKELEKAEKQKEVELKKLETKRLKEEQIKNKEKKKVEKLREQEKIKEEKEELKRIKSKKKEISSIKKEEKKSLPDADELQIEKETLDEKTMLDDDVEKLLPIIDELLEKLPEDVIDEFAQSENFTLYEKVISKYKNK